MKSVTAIIPVFNRADTVSRAIDSVLDQELPANMMLDVVVVDDGSRDDLDKVLSRYGTKITCIRHSGNLGAAAARNTGINAAKGEYVAFLDSDDAWLPGKTAAQLSEMQAKQWVASCTAYFLGQSHGRERVSPLYATCPLGVSDLAWGCFVSPGSTLVCRRSVFVEIGPFDTSMRRLEDWDWLLRFAQRHVLGFIAQPLARIKASQHRAAGDILDALEVIRSKHLRSMSNKNRKRLLAAIDLECAAALHRSGFKLAAFGALVRSLVRWPFRNAALAAILHNRTRSFGRSP